MKVALLSFAHERALDHARLLRARPDVELIAADDDPDRGRHAADLLDVPVTSVDKALAAGPDAVVVTGPPAGRRALVERAAAAGAHVLCEQPLAVDEADAAAMVEACARAGVGLVVSGPARCGPAFAELRRIVADGALGTLLTVHGVHTAAGEAARPGDDLTARLTHLADLVDGMLAGDPPVRVYAQGDALPTTADGAGGTALVTVAYQSGATAALDVRVSATAAAEGPLISVFGTTGNVEFEPYARVVDRFDTATGRDRCETEDAAAHAEVLDRFLAGAATGERTGPDGAAGLRVLSVVLAARRSMELGRPVDLV